LDEQKEGGAGAVGRDTSELLFVLRAHVENMDVDAGVDVVEQVPADVIGIVVDYKVIAAIPAPIDAEGPVPGSDFKIEAAGEPETMVVSVNAHNVVAISGTDTREVTMVERMILVVALVGRIIVTVPVVIVDMGVVVNRTVPVVLIVSLVLLVRRGLGRSWRNMALIGARNALMGTVLFRMLRRMLLGERRTSKQRTAEKESDEVQEGFHGRP